MSCTAWAWCGWVVGGAYLHGGIQLLAQGTALLDLLPQQVPRTQVLEAKVRHHARALGALATAGATCGPASSISAGRDQAKQRRRPGKQESYT